MKEVVAKPSLLDLAVEVATGGRDDSHVGGDRLSCSDRAYLATVDGAKQLRLKLRRQVPDFVEEQCAPIRLDEDPSPRFGGPGKRPLRVAEELGLHQVLGHHRAVEDHEGLLSSWPLLVQGLRQRLLARARLTLDDHGDVCLRQALAQRIEAAHRPTGTLNPAERLARVQGRSRSRFGREAEHTSPDLEFGMRVDPRRPQQRAPYPCAVGGVEVLYAEKSLVPFQRQMPTRNGRIGEAQRACSAGADQHATRM